VSVKRGIRHLFGPGQELERLRQQVLNDIDDLYVAFREAGHTDEEYVDTQWYEGMMFIAWREAELPLIECIGALKVMHGFEQKLIAHYRDEARKLREETPNANRK
jgi:hypothetical protein